MFLWRKKRKISVNVLFSWKKKPYLELYILSDEVLWSITIFWQSNTVCASIPHTSLLTKSKASAQIISFFSLSIWRNIFCKAWQTTLVPVIFLHIQCGIQPQKHPLSALFSSKWKVDKWYSPLWDYQGGNYNSMPLLLNSFISHILHGCFVKCPWNFVQECDIFL